MILDLDATDPNGWTEENFVSETENYTDAQIWEVHIRDFSNKIETSQYKGKSRRPKAERRRIVGKYNAQLTVVGVFVSKKKRLK